MLRRLPSKASSESENSELNKRVEIFLIIVSFRVRFQFIYFNDHDNNVM